MRVLWKEVPVDGGRGILLKSSPLGGSLLRRRGGAEIASSAARARASHPYIIKIVHKRFGFRSAFQQKPNFKISVFLRFCAYTGPSEIRTAHQGRLSIDYENFCVHSYAMKEFKTCAEPARPVELFVPLRNGAEGSSAWIMRKETPRLTSDAIRSTNVINLPLYRIPVPFMFAVAIQTKREALTR